MPRTSWVSDRVFERLVSTLDPKPVLGISQRAHLTAAVTGGDPEFHSSLVAHLGTLWGLVEGAKGLLPVDEWALPLIVDTAPFAHALVFSRVELRLNQVRPAIASCALRLHRLYL
jgi:hypothetical protein